MNLRNYLSQNLVSKVKLDSAYYNDAPKTELDHLTCQSVYSLLLPLNDLSKCQQFYLFQLLIHAELKFVYGALFDEEITIGIFLTGVDEIVTKVEAAPREPTLFANYYLQLNNLADFEIERAEIVNNNSGSHADFPTAMVLKTLGKGRLLAGKAGTVSSAIHCYPKAILPQRGLHPHP